MRGSFHNHTTYSDGRYTPEQVLKKYKKKSVTHIAITDHDNTGSYPDVISLGQSMGVTVIPGIEFSSQFNNFSECHILGLNINYDSPELRAYEREILGGRRTRAEKMVTKMASLDIHLTEEERLDLFHNPSIGRPHIAAILIKNKVVGNVQDAFRKYLNPGQLLYEPKTQWSAERVISFIHQLDGVAILAHPSGNYAENDVLSLVELGLDGLEVVHPLHKLKKAIEWRAFAKKHHLMISGGADYHGLEKSDDKAISKYYLDDDDVRTLLIRLKN